MRQIININKDWRFSKKPQSTPTALPTDWESVDLPHTWNGTDGQDGGNDYYRGKCAYAKALTADELGSAPVHYLQFDGVNSSAQVYWNGKQIAKHDGGYSTFRAKLPEILPENLLVVYADNSPNETVYPQMADFTFYGGIYRDVTVLGVEESHFDLDYYGAPGVQVVPTMQGTHATVAATAYVTAPTGCTVHFAITNRNGDPVAEALAVQAEDIEMCRKISAYGLSLLRDGDGLLTHCNAGELATSRYGTGLGPILLGKEKGYNFKVFSDETRPLLQGARLTSYELEKAGVDVTLICDNMASQVMKNGWIQAVLVGCDRVAMNGDAANKIGTSGVAILAKHYGIPFYVLGPTSTVDPHCATGADIQIEERPGDEIKELYFERPTALPQTKCYNPAFDVTDHDLITAIITDKGILRPPYTESLRALFQEEV